MEVETVSRVGSGRSVQFFLGGEDRRKNQLDAGRIFRRDAISAVRRRQTDRCAHGHALKDGLALLVRRVRSGFRKILAWYDTLARHGEAPSRLGIGTIDMGRGAERYKQS